jgi:threonine/homoserine/homoserine lactone efflux protein
VLALPIKVAVGVAAGSFSERVLRSGSAFKWMNRIGGTVLIALGLRLAASDRV